MAGFAPSTGSDPVGEMAGFGSANLRAAVKKVDWFEPELNPKVVSFCEHYGTVILPTKPASRAVSIRARTIQPNSQKSRI
jgi:hypothetical protein